MPNKHRGQHSKNISLQKGQLQEAEVKAELAKSGAERNFVPHS